MTTSIALEMTTVQATKTATIPVAFGGRKVHLATNVIAKEIALLIFCDCMKKAGMTIGLENDTTIVFGNLSVTKSGHYTLSFTPATQFIAERKISLSVNTTLICNSS